MEKQKKRIAILGAGPSGLFMFKRLVASKLVDFEIDIYERKMQLGAGMPYSTEGANVEHITNVSDNEIPQIVTSIEEWVTIAPREILDKFNIHPENFNEYKVLPRLFFGHYLSAQFDLLLQAAEKAGITIRVHLGSTVQDIIYTSNEDKVGVEVKGTGIQMFDRVIICTGHNWPAKHEGYVPGYYDAPYPPSKLALQLNHPVAIKGSSLTAIDAIRTLARNNGTFIKNDHGKLSFQPSQESSGFKMVMHSRSGLLPALRFHLEDSHLSNKSLLTPEQIAEYRAANDGFLSLDYVFEKDFKDMFLTKDPAFYQRIKNMRIEEFVETMMELRERLEPFQLLKAEYVEAEQSIKRKESVYWKEMLAVLSFAMNYPAKYLSAEDMQRLQKVLMPLISIVIAFVPQSSCTELLALNDAGVLDIVSVGSDGQVEPKTEGGITYHYTDENNTRRSDYYKTFVDCVGQPHLSYKDLPFKSLVTHKIVSPAQLRFQSAEEGKRAMEAGNNEVVQDEHGDFYLSVPGITINDDFQVIDSYGAFNNRIFIMAVPYIGGFNPDYSGLDFCEAASERIVKRIMEN